ncbi:OmpW family outer membrane protein [Granulosicoccaceae sp. 1_MG-2023]|nr:OmpW family outer membrane protein [Granulosicoccaceae sp. 1_MG-2023]
MKKSIVAVCVALACAAGTAQAYEAGDIVLRVGVVNVNPQGDGALDEALDVDDNTQLGINLTYMFTDTLGVGVLGATPFEHDITLNGDKIATTKHLPPTVTLQYHFNTGTAFHPYAGLGFNYTFFFDEDLKADAVGDDLELDPSFGFAAELGMDYSIDDNWGVGASLFYADIDTDAEVDGADLDTVEIDPLVILISGSYKF